MIAGITTSGRESVLISTGWPSASCFICSAPSSDATSSCEGSAISTSGSKAVTVSPTLRILDRFLLGVLAAGLGFFQRQLGILDLALGLDQILIALAVDHAVELA